MQTLDGHPGTCESAVCLLSILSVFSSFVSGIFLCIRCSGIHRGMGTHISKVKSIDLDAWTPEQMQVYLKSTLNAARRTDRVILVHPTLGK